MDQNNPQPTPQTTPPAAPPAPVQTESTQVKTNPQVTSILPWILVIIFLLATGYLAYQNYQLSSKISSLTYSSPTPTSSSTELKTYTNTEWGISFQYPSYLNPSDPNNSAVAIEERIDSILLSSPPQWILNFQRFENKTIAQIISEIDKSVLNSPKKTDLGVKKINGYDAREVVYKYDQGDVHYYLFQKGRDVIEIYTGFSLAGVDQILSTFKFTDSSSRVYSDTDFGYQFSYSSNGNVQKMQKRDTLLIGGSIFKLINSSNSQPQSSEVGVLVYDSQGKTLKEWLNANSTSQPFGSPEQKEFYGYSELGQSSIASTSGISFKNEVMGFTNTNTAVKRGDYIFVIYYVKVADDLSSDFNQIRSTFKFTN